MIKRQRPTRMRFTEPSLIDRRGEQRLLLWGELAQWMVVDKELEGFMRLFDGRRTLAQVVKRHASTWGRDPEEVDHEVKPLVADLEARSILRRAGRPASSLDEPTSIANITINLTNHCNLRCSFCYNAGRVETTGAEIDVVLLAEAIRDAKPLLEENASLIVLGGEPFVTPQRLFALLEETKGLFSTPTLISTNGTRMDESVIARLTRYNVEVQVSLDSPIDTEHDAIRGAGCFEKATLAARNLAKAGIKTICSMVYTSKNIDHLEAYLDLTRELGTSEARFIPMRSLGGGQALTSLVPSQLRAFEGLLDVLERRPELGSLMARDYFSLLFSVCRFSQARSGCGVGRRVLFIDADGVVYPCPNHTKPEHAAGDIRLTPITSIVANSNVMKAARDTYHVARYTRCKACDFRHWCAGDCRGEVLALTGDAFAPSPHCDDLRQIMRRMFWLIADGDARLGTRPELESGQEAKDVYRV